jgi:hypothetical protein
MHVFDCDHDIVGVFVRFHSCLVPPFRWDQTILVLYVDCNHAIVDLYARFHYLLVLSFHRDFLGSSLSY